MKNRKWMTLALAAGMLGLTACGSSSSSTGTTAAATEAATEAAAETEAAADTEEAEATEAAAADEDLTPIDNYPASTLQITCPPAAGGGTDVLIRELAIYMEDYLNVPITVVNKSGGGCAIGYAAGATDPTDGSCITVGVAELMGLPYTTDFEYSYHDFEPICNFNACYGTVCVPADAPYDTIEDFVTYMKDNPGQVRWANSGIGGPWHLMAGKFAQIADVNIVHVPYDGGGPAAIACAGGNVEAVDCSDAEVKTYVESGLLKMLLTFSPETLSSFPDVPLASEYGYEACSDVVVFRGLLAPAGMSQEAKDMIDASVRYALAQPEVQEFMATNAYTSNYMDETEFGALLDSMDQICADMSTELGISNN